MYLPDIDLQWLSPLIFVFALTVGSFLNVVIHRIPVMMQREWDAMAND
jgi:leader peptidase (prepilin peptidase)/N-methyltransferase